MIHVHLDDRSSTRQVLFPSLTSSILSSSSEDEEFILLASQHVQKNNRVECFIEEVIEKYNDKEVI